MIGPSPDRRRPLRPRNIIVATLAALILAALFGSGALVGLAERQPLGPQRDVTLDVAEAVDRAANFLSLNRPADGLVTALGGDEKIYDVDDLIAGARAAATGAADGPDGTVDGSVEQIAGATDQESDPGSPPSPNAGVDDGTDNGESTPGTRDSGRGEDTDVSDAGQAGDPNADTNTGSGDGNLGAGGAEDGTAGQRNEQDCNPAEISPNDPTDPFLPFRPEGRTTTGTSPNETVPSDDCPAGTFMAGTIPLIGAFEPLPTATTAAFVAPRTPVPSSPLQIYVWGDSISQNLAEGLARLTPVDLVRLEMNPRQSTGLSRPDFFDWPQHLAGVLVEEAVDVFVVMLGANDFQDVNHEGQYLSRRSDEWVDLYRERVDRVMALLGQPGVQTVWVGVPPLRESESRLSEGIPILNEAYAAQATEHRHVTFVDTWELFTDEEGNYTDEIDGVRVRTKDGVHLTVAGSNRLAAAVWEAIVSAWRLD